MFNPRRRGHIWQASPAGALFHPIRRDLETAIMAGYQDRRGVLTNIKIGHLPALFASDRFTWLHVSREDFEAWLERNQGVGA